MTTSLLLHFAESSAKQRLAVEDLIHRHVCSYRAKSGSGESENARWTTLLENRLSGLL